MTRTSENLGQRFLAILVAMSLGCTVASCTVASRAVAGRAVDVGPLADAGPPTRDAFVPLPDPVDRVIFGEGVPADAPLAFAAAPVANDGRRSPTIVYPLDGAVMPRNVPAAEVQWLNGARGELVRVSLSNTTVHLTVYLRDDGGQHYAVEAEGWRALTQGDPGGPSSLRVDRLSEGSVYEGNAVSVTFVRPTLAGAMYFWSLTRERIVRVDDATTERTEFMPTPNVVGGHRCVGCHTVSRSGRYLSGSLNIQGGAVWDLTTDLTGSDPPTSFPVDTPESPRWHFSSFGPGDLRIIAGMRDTATPLSLFDVATGARIAAPGLPARGTMPAWSPDGRNIAYVTSDTDPSFGGAAGPAHIAVLPVIGHDAFGDAAIIHRGDAAAGGVIDSYPSWSPDSRRIAFGHGTSTELAERGRILTMGPDGSNVVELGNASGEDDAYIPVFSPFAQGGYYWLAFLSRRDYGNAEVGTRGARRDQIWVTAIRSDAAPGEDPSAVPYWLPGQSVDEVNVWSYWAPRACRAAGTSCGYDGDCCSDYCIPDSFECAPTPPDRCRNLSQTCDSTEDCCGGSVTATCAANVCVEALF